jgi:dihydroorotate dehydrogenase (fumarate)
MDLTTKYLGLELSSPLLPGASPLADALDVARRLEDAGAAAVVMRSLFEEQIRNEQIAQHLAARLPGEAHAAMRSTLQPEDFVLGPDEYLEQVRRLKEAVGVPVIASLNGTTDEGWLDYSRRIEQAGADALELNVYFVATSAWEDSAMVEGRIVSIASAVKEAVGIPLAVKLTPFFSSVAQLARRLDRAGTDGLVLFNRFYQPDVDVETLSVVPRLDLSDSSELPLRLHWLAVLFDRVRPSLAASGGVHTALDAMKAIMVGADVVQMVSALMRHGPNHLRTVRDEMVSWMQQHDYRSIRELRGVMSLQRCPDPAAFERASYMRVLQSRRR